MLRFQIREKCRFMVVKCGECGKADVKKVLGDDLDICNACFSRWLLVLQRRFARRGP